MKCDASINFIIAYFPSHYPFSIQSFPILLFVMADEKKPVKRVVPMEVLVLGVSRTGTSSTREALKILGFRDVYDYDYMTWHWGHAELWSKAIRAKWEGGPPMTRDDWDTLLGRCRAVVDNPANLFGKELSEVYPEAKVGDPRYLRVVLIVLDCSQCARQRRSMVEVL